MRSLTAALLYPGLAMLEYSKNYSVGRGTDAPFEMIGADFINGSELAAYLNSRHVPGMRFYPTQFQPTSSNFAGQRIEGVRLLVTNREVVDSAHVGFEVAAALQKLYPGKIDFAVNQRLIGSTDVIRAFEAGRDPWQIGAQLEDGLSSFAKIREKYLLYR